MLVIVQILKLKATVNIDVFNKENLKSNFIIDGKF